MPRFHGVHASRGAMSSGLPDGSSADAGARDAELEGDLSNWTSTDDARQRRLARDRRGWRRERAGRLRSTTTAVPPGSGAPIGYRNGWKNGRYSRAAKEERRRERQPIKDMRAADFRYGALSERRRWCCCRSAYSQKRTLTRPWTMTAPRCEAVPLGGAPSRHLTGAMVRLQAAGLPAPATPRLLRHNEVATDLADRLATGYENL
jgi:hypothetical protein